MTAAAEYAANFLESSLGLVSGQVRARDVPKALLEELTTVLRGGAPEDPRRPSLEARIRDFLLELESSALEERGFFVRKARWPGGAPVAVCLSHDVDNIERPLEHVLKVKERFEKADFDKAMKGRLSLYNNIKLISKNEGDHGLRSTFYLLSANYPLAGLRETARILGSRGWEFGLHGDFGTHDSEQEMKKAVERFTDGLGSQPRGVREHYLRFDYGSSWRIMEASGFDYDTTLGNSDSLGFKLGLATPFHPPDLGWKPMRLLELPLSLMDTTIWGYLKKGEEEGFAEVFRSMQMVEEVEGLFTLLWHQEAVRMKGGRVYWRILRELSKRKDIFIATSLEIARWWRSREVPMTIDGEGTVRLAGRPPKGLTLILKTRSRMKVSVASGSLARTSRDGLLVSPKGRSFRLRISGAR